MSWHEDGWLGSAGGPRDIASLLVGEGVRSAPREFVGLGSTVVIGRVMTGLLFNVTSTDPLTLAAAGFFLLAVAFAACDVPARRAARLDATAVMRP